MIPKKRVKNNKIFEQNQDYILSVIRNGAERANAVAEKTLRETKEFMKQIF